MKHAVLDMFYENQTFKNKNQSVQLVKAFKIDIFRSLMKHVMQHEKIKTINLTINKKSYDCTRFISCADRCIPSVAYWILKMFSYQHA